MSFGEKIRRFLASRRRHKLWQRIVGGLGIVVVFVTTYMLILPAITMEKPTYCGIEEHSHTQECYLSCSEGESAPPEYSCGGLENYIHKHNEDCYYNGELVCPLEERENHVHTQECYTEEQRLICGQEESEGHTHDESCYDVRDELVCGMDEGEEHTHDESCYEHIEELICGQEESEGHTHDDSCYETVRVYNCTAASAHIHDADCYDADGSLICNLEEAEEHIHSDACMTRHENKDHKHTDECYSDTPLCGKTEHKHTDACYENPDKETSGGGSSDDKTEETSDNHKDENNDHMGYDEPVIIDDVLSGAMAGPQFLDLNADGDTPDGAPNKFDADNVKVYLSTGSGAWDSDPFMPSDTGYSGVHSEYAGYHLVADINNVSSDGKIADPVEDGMSEVSGVRTALGIDPANTDFYNTEGFLVGEIYYAKEGSDNLPIPQGAKVDVYLNVQGAAGERYLQVVAKGKNESEYTRLTSDIDTISGTLEENGNLDWYDMIKHFWFVTDASKTAENNEYCFVSAKVFGGYVESINYSKEGGDPIIDGTPNLLDATTAENGYDDSLTNRLIRTFDNIQYNLTFGLNNRGVSSPRNTERLKVEFSQKKDISQAVFNISDMSWLQDWRIDYYNSADLNEDGTPAGELVAYETANGKFRKKNTAYDYLQFKNDEEIDKGQNSGQYTSKKMDLQWWDDSDKVGENGFIKTDYNEIIRAHQKTTNKEDLVSSYDSGIRYQVLTGYTKVSLPGTQNRTVGIRVLASANGDEIVPKFDAYFEGNPLNLDNEIIPNTESQEMEQIFKKPTRKDVLLDTESWGPNSVAAGSGVEEVKDNGKVKVTAEPRYKFNIQSNDNLSYRGYFNLTTGTEDTKGNTDENIYGRMVGYGVTLTLVNDSDNPETKKNKGIMGIELPTDDVTLNFNVESANTDSKKFSTLSLEPTQPIMRLNSAVEGTFFSEITLDDGAGILSILSSNGEVDTDLSETESVDYADENTDNADEYEYDSDNNYIENYDENSGDTAPIDEEGNVFTLSDDDNSYFDALVSDDTEYMAGAVDSINDTVFDALFDEEFYDLMANYGSDVGIDYKFEESTNGGTKTWDFTNVTAKTLSEGDTIEGGLLMGNPAPSLASGNNQFYVNSGVFYIEVPDNTDGCTLSIWTSRTSGSGASIDLAITGIGTYSTALSGKAANELKITAEQLKGALVEKSEKKYLELKSSGSVRTNKIVFAYTINGGTGDDTDEGKIGTHTEIGFGTSESWGFTSNMPTTADVKINTLTNGINGITFTSVSNNSVLSKSNYLTLASGDTLNIPIRTVSGMDTATIKVDTASGSAATNLTANGTALDSSGEYSYTVSSAGTLALKATANVNITGITVTYSKAAAPPPVTEGNIVSANIFGVKRNANQVVVTDNKIDSTLIQTEYTDGTDNKVFKFNTTPGTSNMTGVDAISYVVPDLATVTFNARSSDVGGKTIDIEVPSGNDIASSKLYVFVKKTSNTTYLLEDKTSGKQYKPGKEKIEGVLDGNLDYVYKMYEGLKPGDKYLFTIEDTDTPYFVGMILVNTKDPLDTSNWEYPEGYTGAGEHTAPDENTENPNTEVWGFTSGCPGVDQTLDSDTDLNGITYVSGGGTSTFKNDGSGIVLASGDGLKIPTDTTTYTGGNLKVTKTGVAMTIDALPDDGYKFTSRDIKDNSVTITANGETTITGITIAYDKPKDGTTYGTYNEDIYTWNFGGDNPSNAEKAYLTKGDTLDGNVKFICAESGDCQSYFSNTALVLFEGDSIEVPLPSNILSGKVQIGTGTEARDITSAEIDAKKITITGEIGGTTVTTIALSYPTFDTPADIVSANIYFSIGADNVKTNTATSTISGVEPSIVYSNASTNANSPIGLLKSGSYVTASRSGSLSGTPKITDPNGKGEISLDLKDRFSFETTHSATINVPSGVGSAKLYVFGKGDGNKEVLFTLTDTTNSSRKYYNDAYIGFKSGGDLQTVEFTDLQPNHKYEFKSAAKICPNGFALIGFQSEADTSKWVSSQPSPESTTANVRVYVYTPYSRSSSNDKFTNLSIPEYQVHYQGYSASTSVGGLTIFDDSKSQLSGSSTSTQSSDIADIGTIQTSKRNSTSIDDSDSNNKIGGYLTFTVPNTVDGVKSARLYVNNCVSSGSDRTMELKNSAGLTQTITIEGTGTYPSNGKGKDIVFTDLKPGETYTLTFDTGANNTRFGSIVLVLSDSEETTDPWYDPNFEVDPTNALVYAFLPYPESIAKSNYTLSTDVKAIYTQYEPSVTTEENIALDIFSDYKTSDGTAVHNITKGKFTGTIDGYGSVTSTKETGKSNSTIKISVPNTNTEAKSAKLYVIAGSSSTDAGEDRIITLKNQEYKIQSYKITGDIPAIQRVMEFTDLTPGKTYTLTPSAVDGTGDSNVRYVAIVLVFSTTAEPDDSKWNLAGTTPTLSEPEAEPTPSANTDLNHIPFLWDYDPNYQPDDYGTWHRNLDWDKDGWRTNSARNAAPYNYGWERRNAGNDIEEKANYSYPETEVNAVYGTEEYEVHWGGDWFVNEKYKLASVSDFKDMKENKKGNTPDGGAHVDGVNQYPVTVNGYEFDFENNSNMWFPTNYGGHSMGSHDFSDNGFGKYKLAYSVGYFETLVPFDANKSETVTVRGTVREFKAKSLGGTTVFQDSKGEIAKDNSDYNVDNDEDQAKKVTGTESYEIDRLQKYISFMARGATNINDKDITDATRNDPSMRDDTNNIKGQFLGNSWTTAEQDWDASASVGDKIDAWSGCQVQAPSDGVATALNFMQKYDSAVLDLDKAELSSLKKNYDTLKTEDDWKDKPWLDDTKANYEYMLLGRTWDTFYTDAKAHGLEPEVNILWGVRKSTTINSTIRTDGYNTVANTSDKDSAHRDNTDTTSNKGDFTLIMSDKAEQFDWYDEFDDKAIGENKISAVMAEVRDAYMINGLYFGFRFPLVVSDKAQVGEVYVTTDNLEGWSYVEAAGANQPMREFTWLNTVPTAGDGELQKVSISSGAPDSMGNYYNDPKKTDTYYFTKAEQGFADYAYGKNSDDSPITAQYYRRVRNDCGFTVTRYWDCAVAGEIGDSSNYKLWQHTGTALNAAKDDKDNVVKTACSYGMGLLITDYKSQVEIDVDNGSNIVGGIPYYNKADSESPVYRIHNIKTFTNRINGSSYGETGKESYKTDAAKASLDLRVDLTKLENAADSKHGGVYVSFDKKACPVVKFVTGTDENGKPTYSTTEFPLELKKSSEVTEGDWVNVTIPEDALKYQGKTGPYSYQIRAIFDGGGDDFTANRTIKFEYKDVPHMVDLGDILLTTDMSVVAEPNTLVTAKATITGTNNKGDVRNYAAYSKNMDTTQIGISATSGAENRKYVDVTNAPEGEADYIEEFVTGDSKNVVNPELGQEIVYTLAFSNVTSTVDRENVYFYDILDNVMDKVNKGHLDVKAVKVFSSAAIKRDVDQKYPYYEVFFTDETDKAKIAEKWGNKDSTGDIEIPVFDDNNGEIKISHNNKGGGSEDDSIIQLKATDHNHTAVYFKIGKEGDPAVGAGRMLYIQLICEPVAVNAGDVQTKNAQSSILASDFSNTAVFIVPSTDTGSDTTTYNISETDTARFAPVGRSISGVVWEDGDGNGIRLRTDRLLSGVRAALFEYKDGKYVKVEKDMLGNPLGNIEHASGDDIGVYVTGENGAYSFNNLPEGKYVVAFDYDEGLPQISPHQPAGTSATNEMHRDDNTNDAVDTPKDHDEFEGYRFITKYNYKLDEETDTGDISPIPLDSAENIAANYSNNYQNETNWDIGFAIAGDPLPETGGVGTEGIKYAGLAIACGAALMLMWDYTKRSKYGKH